MVAWWNMRYPSRWEWNGLIADWKAVGKGFPSQKKLQLTETWFGLGLHNLHYVQYRHTRGVAMKQTLKITMYLFLGPCNCSKMQFTQVPQVLLHIHYLSDGNGQILNPVCLVSGDWHVIQGVSFPCTQYSEIDSDYNPDQDKKVNKDKWTTKIYVLLMNVLLLTPETEMSHSISPFPCLLYIFLCITRDVPLNVSVF